MCWRAWKVSKVDGLLSSPAWRALQDGAVWWGQLHRSVCGGVWRLSIPAGTRPDQGQDQLHQGLWRWRVRISAAIQDPIPHYTFFFLLFLPFLHTFRIKFSGWVLKTLGLPTQLGAVRGAQLPWPHVYCGEGKLLLPHGVAGGEPKHPVCSQGGELLLKHRRRRRREVIRWGTASFTVKWSVCGSVD